VEKPALKVVVRVDPPTELSREQFNELMDGELTAFEADLRRRQQGRGLQGDPLISAERGLLKAYIYFAHGRSA
jgi:hypothetical protein